MTVKIIPATSSFYQTFYCQLSEIYFESSGNDYHEQFLDMDKETEHLNDLIKNEDCLFAIQKNQLEGFLFSKPLTRDRFLPEEIKTKFEINKCYYIAEMAIKKDSRHQGIGTKLVNYLFKTIDQNLYDFIFVAGWTQNIPAINLYKKLGFIPFTQVQQTKIKKDQSEKFTINKQYLYKKL